MSDPKAVAMIKTFAIVMAGLFVAGLVVVGIVRLVR